MNHDRYDDSKIRGILSSVKTIAVVGASPNASRPSYGVMKFLISKGYKVIPINPGHAGKTILDQPVYASLADVPVAIDMVDVFRNPDSLPGIVDEVIALETTPDVLWGQLTVRNDEAAELAENAGITVIMDRCPAIEYPRLIG